MTRERREALACILMGIAVLWLVFAACGIAGVGGIRSGERGGVDVPALVFVVVAGTVLGLAGYGVLRLRGPE